MIYLHFMCIMFACIYVYVRCECLVTVEAPREYEVPSLELLTGSHLRVLRTKLGHSVRATSVQKLQAASLSPLLLAEVK